MLQRAKSGILSILEDFWPGMMNDSEKAMVETTMQKLSADESSDSSDHSMPLLMVDQ